jgi:hypothetical protein
MNPSAIPRYRDAPRAVSLAAMSASITDFVIIPAAHRGRPR